MSRSTAVRRRRRFLTAVAAVGVATGLTAPAAAQAGGMAETPAIHSVRSIVHILGIVTSVVLGYYAVRARRQFQGGVFATSAKHTAIGAAAFALAFLNVELEHQFGVAPFAVLGIQGTLAVRMGLFAVSVFAFSRAMYLLASTLQEWELT